ncbi:MAG: YvcK family protein [Candidatus Portnoybacteria bacterium]|jgi:uncharacterized cofD-like protein|nr:YvcK family protein [Candidatus Portnoybacteria bacterium]
MKRIVVIGGGTGSFVVLSGLKKYTKNISAIVNMSDNGRSTGRLRDELGVLPPGDVRSCLVALAGSDQILRDLFNYRFSAGKGLEGHSFGNLFLTALEKITGNFEEAIKQAAKILAIDGEVIPVTTRSVNLCARLEDGQVIRGQTQIDRPVHDANLKIKKVWLEPFAKANPRALAVIKKADFIVVGPGDFYTSLVPNFLVNGIAQAVKWSRAKKIFVCNLTTKFGETNNWSVSAFVREMGKYIGGSLDYVIFNEGQFPPRLLKRYAKENKVPVKFDCQNKTGSRTKYLGSDLASHKTLIRHDSDRLARLIISIVQREASLKFKEY